VTTVQQKEMWDDRREALVVFLGGQCASCGQRDFEKLQFDHIDNTLVPRTKGAIWRLPVEKIELELGNLQLLCVSCHPLKSKREAGFD
jgi:5-methylcytosine-specific restriction endonuclease McrA